jgi:hypothetical protein
MGVPLQSYQDNSSPDPSSTGASITIHNNARPAGRSPFERLELLQGLLRNEGVGRISDIDSQFLRIGNTSTTGEGDGNLSSLNYRIGRH